MFFAADRVSDGYVADNWVGKLLPIKTCSAVLTVLVSHLISVSIGENLILARFDRTIYT